MPPLFPELPEIAEAVDNPTAEDYAAAAKYALRRKQRPLAVQQVAAALALNPQNHRHLQLLSEIVGTTPDPLALLGLRSEGTFYGIAAARAWMLAKRQEATEATRLLAEVVQFQPNTPFLPWLGEWQERFDWVRRVNPDVVGGLLRGLVAELLSRGLDPGGEANLEAALQAAEALQQHHPSHAPLRAARMWTLRQLEEPDAALALAADAPAAWEVESERARCLFVSGDADGELGAWQGAVELAPSQPESYLELAQAWVRRQRRHDAEAVLSQAQQRAPSPASAAALAYLRWLSGDLTAPCEVTAGDAGRAFLRDSQAYRELLPDPNDDAVRVVRGALARVEQTQSPELIRVRAAVSHRAAPSASLAFELGLAALGKQGQLTLMGEAPANALGQLWSVDADRPRPQLPPPEAALVEVVARLAKTRFEWSRWLEHARTMVAESLGTAEPLELVAVALHPPTPPTGADAVQWLMHVHVAIAVLLGAMNDTPSREHAIARCLAAGDDWVCNIGLVALWGAASCGTLPLEVVQHELASLLDGADEGAPCVRTLAVVGSLAGGARVSEFLDLRARLVLERVQHRDRVR